MQRRSVLKILCAAQLLATGSRLVASPSTKSTGANKPKTQQTTFTIYIDTLIPADAASPAASTLGVADRMWGATRLSASTLALYSDGLKWLERTAFDTYRKSFADLDELQRIEIINLAEESDAASLQRRFFIETRDWAMELYYSHPDTWRSFGRLHAPQPLGYYDYSSPPEET